MKLTPQIVEEIKTLYFHGDNKQQAAITIKFVNDEGLKKTGYWEFVKCEFMPENTPYTINDWEFLASIYEKIKELTK